MRNFLVIAATATLVVSAAGCGGDDSSDDGTAAPKGAITVKMSDYAFDPQDATATAGDVTITAPNDGNEVHELVVLKTDADPAALPMEGDEVDESTAVGEIADVEAGDTKKATLKLAAGKYVMVCALPGHYQKGMYGTLTVR